MSTIRDAVFGNPPVEGFKPSREGVVRAFEELSAVVAGTSAGFIMYETKTLMDADTTQDDGAQGRVWNDPTPANNAVYVSDGGIWSVDTDYYNQIATVVQPLVDDAEDWSILSGHFANDATDVAVPGQGDTNARGSKFWSLVSATSATLSGHFANDSTDVAVPGQGDTNARGAKYWALEAEASARGQTIGLVLPALPVEATIFAEFSGSKYYNDGFTYVDFDEWVTGLSGSFTRGGTHHPYINSAGLIAEGTADVPRITYDPITLAPLGLLYEPASANLFGRSQEITVLGGTTWQFGPAGSVCTDNAAIGPDGTMNAGFFREDGSTGLHRIFYYTDYFTLAAGTSYAYQFFLKAAGRTRIMLDPIGGLNFGPVNVDLTAKTVSDTSWSLEEWQNGWFRLCTNAIATGGGSGATSIVFNLLDASGSVSYAGDDASGMYIGGHMLEVGSTPTTYIKRTDMPAATRNADALSFTIPAGVSEITYSFGDLTTQLVSVSPGAYAVPTSLNKRQIKSLITVDLATVGNPVTSVAGRIGDVTLVQADVTGLKTSSSPTFAGLTLAATSINLGGAVFKNTGQCFQWTVNGATGSDGYRAQIIGHGAAQHVASWSNSTVIGTDAANQTTTIATAVVIGDTAGANCSTISNSNLIGNEAGNNGGTVTSSNIVGNVACKGGTVSQSEVMGQGALTFNASAKSIVLGFQAGLGVSGNSATINQSVLIGASTGNSIVGAGGSNLILIGYNIQPPTSTTTNYLSIGNAFIQNLLTGATKIQKPDGTRAKLSLPGFAASASYANDAAAAAGGVAVDEIYRNGNIVQVRIV